MRGLWVPQPVTTTSSELLWLTLLFLAPAIRSNGPPRAMLTLDPPWFHVFRGDNVTLNCEGFQNPGQDFIEWFHNGTLSSFHQDSYIIPAANYEDGGYYQCRTKQTSLSNSVKLIVSSDWLLLQVEKLEFMEGEMMTLRCHSWRSKSLHKVTFYHNDRALLYEFQSFNLVIPKVNYTHSGTYSCTGNIGHNHYQSANVVITIQGGNPSTAKVVIIILVTLVLIAIIVAAVIYYYKRHRQLDNIPDETARFEVSNSMAYSLLKNTDNPEEEASGPTTYQNHK
ncbi:low affinity immunoglobulin gamma Fc region receptor II-like [Macrotis lagotis]|uniref:low affinity immunoglobulin gamma Fc region receptor II-like n=1 Tax=Macrotis lagotis TaxID=92651 RepID=UPI003D693C6F